MPGRLLIADSVAANRVVLTAMLGAACYDPVQASGADEAAGLLRRVQPGVAIIDTNIADQASLSDLCRDLRAHSSFHRLPILVTAGPDSPIDAAEVFEAGGDALVRRPVERALLMAQVRALARARDTVEEAARRRQTASQMGFSEPPARFRHGARLALVSAVPGAPPPAAGLPARTRRMTAREALDLTDPRRAPELIFLPVDATNAEAALPLLSEMRSRPATRHAGFIVLAPGDRPDLAAQALDLGAADVAPTDCTERELAQRVRRQLHLKRTADALRHAIDEGFRIAVTDPLTGLHNRRYAEFHLARIHDEACAAGRGYAVLMADLDRFKQINDTHGHAAGDTVLIEAGHRLRQALRSSDLLARIGGEEFLAILPETTPEAARRVARRLSEALRGTPIALPDGTAGACTVTGSFGLACVPPYGTSGAAIARADRALYLAKAAGRNRVEVDTPPPAPRCQCSSGGARRSEWSNRSA